MNSIFPRAPHSTLCILRSTFLCGPFRTLINTPLQRGGFISGFISTVLTVCRQLAPLNRRDGPELPRSGKPGYGLPVYSNPRQPEHFPFCSSTAVSSPATFSRHLKNPNAGSIYQPGGCDEGATLGSRQRKFYNPESGCVIFEGLISHQDSRSEGRIWSIKLVAAFEKTDRKSVV